MKTKNFKEEMKIMSKALGGLNKIIRESKSRISIDRAMRAREVQEERIRFFTMGYNCRDKEIRSQTNFQEEVKEAVSGNQLSLFQEKKE